METPLLNALLEGEKVSTLLADSAQLFPAPTRAWLMDAEGHLVGYHPAAAQDVDVEELLAVVDRVRQVGSVTPVSIGVATPILVKGHIAGALIVATPENLDPQQTAALQLLGRFASLLAEDSLTHKDQLRAAVEGHRDLDLLYQAVETIASSLDLSCVNRFILDESARLTQAEEGAVMLPDPETGKLTVWASRGLDPILDIGCGVPLGHYVAERVIQTGESELVERPDPGARKKPLGALLCVPLKTKDEVLGVVSLAHTDPETSFRPNEINLVNALAGQAAVAIENALMFRDLSTVQAELEDANRNLLELDKLKSSFLGVVTHELRSPFANITFCLQLIERHGTQGWTEQQRELWGDLIDDVQGAKRMIDNLVSFATLLREQGELDLNAVSFPALVEDATEALIPVGRTRNIRLIVDADEGMPQIWADKRRLSEAVYHLIHNAIKFNRTGGMVRVRYRSDDDKVWFEVRDTGVGISADKLNVLWDPFSQVADPLTRGIEGLGLGLALVKFVVCAHGGRVGVSSRKGAGSAFSFWVPISGPGAPTSAAPQGQTPVTMDHQTPQQQVALAADRENGRLVPAPEGADVVIPDLASTG